MSEALVKIFELGDPRAVAALQEAHKQLEAMEASEKKLAEAAGLTAQQYRQATQLLEQQEKAAEQVAAAEAKAASERQSSMQRAEAGWTALAAKIDVVKNVLGAALGAFSAVGSFALEGAANAERHREALARLGSAYSLVQEATNGAVTAEQALSAQQRIVQSGLRVEHTQLATLTRAAREYARATGTETTQALEQLTDALIGGEAEGLRRFGVSLRQGQEGAEAFGEALQQLQRQHANTQVSALSVAEQTEQTNRRFQELRDELGATTNGWLGLNDAMRQANDLLRAMQEEGVGVVEELGDFFRDLVGARTVRSVRAEEDARQRQVQAQEYAQALQAAQSAGGRVTGAPDVMRYHRLSDADRARVLSALQGVTAAGRVFSERDPLAENVEGWAVSRSVRESRQRANRQAGLGVREAELAAVLASLSEGGTTGAGANTRSRAAASSSSRRTAGGGGAAPEEFAENATEWLAVKAAMQETGLSAGELAARYGTLQRAVSSLAETREQAARSSLLEGTQQMERERAQAQADLDLRQRLRGFEEERRRAADARRAESKQRMGEQEYELRMARSYGEQLSRIFRSTETQAQLTARVVSSAWQTMTTSFGTHMTAVVMGEESFGAAMRAMTAEVLKAASTMMWAEGLKEAGLSIASFATGNIPGGVAHATAAGVLAAGAAATGALAGALTPSSPAASGSAAPSAPVAGGTGSAGGGGQSTTIVNNYYSPVISGREATASDVGDELQRYQPRTRRVRS